MNILLSSPGFFPHSFGGGEVYVYRLAKELLRRGHGLNVVTPVSWSEGTGPHVIKEYIYEDIPVISLAVNPDSISLEEKLNGCGPEILSALREFLKRGSPDLVHINGMKSCLVPVCRAFNIPHVVTAHHAGIVCPAGGLLRPDGSVCDSQITPKNCVPCCSFHRRSKWYTGGVIGRMPSWIYRPLGRRLGKMRQLNYLERGLITPWLIERTMAEKKTILQNAQLFIAPSIFMRDLLVRSGCNPDKVVVIPHGIEPVEATPLLSRTGMPVRFGYVGRIDPSKGLHVLLQAAELLPKAPACEIHIFGAARNPWDEAYRKRTMNKYKGRARVIDHGLMPHDRLKEAYAQIDVLVVPSLLPEAFGLVVAEAFSAGRPVIVFNSGALPELVTHGRDGFIVEKNDSKSLAMAMQQFIDDPGLIIKMAEQIPPVRTIQEHVDDMEKIYLRMVGEMTHV
jgi:glycosyltransferase involved in cell wall biosynthesis